MDSLRTPTTTTTQFYNTASPFSLSSNHSPPTRLSSQLPILQPKTEDSHPKPILLRRGKILLKIPYFPLLGSELSVREPHTEYRILVPRRGPFYIPFLASTLSTFLLASDVSLLLGTTSCSLQPLLPSHCRSVPVPYSSACPQPYLHLRWTSYGSRVAIPESGDAQHVVRLVHSVDGSMKSNSHSHAKMCFLEAPSYVLSFRGRSLLIIPRSAPPTDQEYSQKRYVMKE